MKIYFTSLILSLFTVIVEAKDYSREEILIEIKTNSVTNIDPSLFPSNFPTSYIFPGEKRIFLAAAGELPIAFDGTNAQISTVLKGRVYGDRSDYLFYYLFRRKDDLIVRYLLDIERKIDQSAVIGKIDRRGNVILNKPYKLQAHIIIHKGTSTKDPDAKYFDFSIKDLKLENLK